MSSEGIAYKILLRTASYEQLLLLCEPELRKLLAAKVADEVNLNEEQRRRLLTGAADISFASRDCQGSMVLLELIKEKKQGEHIRSLASFAQLDTIDEKQVYSYYQANPHILEKYLVWTRDIRSSGSNENNITGIVRPQRGLRYYQLNGVRKILDILEKESRCLYHAPTGAGKTRTAMAVVARHFLRYGPTKVLWLASTSELIDQACIAFKQEWECKGDTDAVLYGWRGHGDSFNPEQATRKNTMLVASVQLLSLRREDIGTLKEDVSLIVFDEAHQSLAPTYQEILKILLENPKCKLLGLSATPIRVESEKASQELENMYGRNKIKIHSGRQNPIEYLVSNGYLAKTYFKKFSYYLQNILKPKPHSEDYDQKLLDWLGYSVERNDAIIDYVKEAISQGRKRVLVFTPNILSATYCALMLRILHEVHYSYSISGGTPRSERERRLAKFTSVESSPVVIFNCQVLTTGFDAPQTDAVVVARPTKSPTLYAQMIGRALRGPESGGTDEAYIYTFADQNLEGYNHLVDLFENFEGSWVSDDG